jgi:hypothetical protein
MSNAMFPNLSITKDPLIIITVTITTHGAMFFK